MEHGAERFLFADNRKFNQISSVTFALFDNAIITTELQQHVYKHANR